MDSEKETSEFGKGWTYSLGLFLAHQERLIQTIQQYAEMRKKSPDIFSEQSAVEMFFYGAADHLFDLQFEYAPTPELVERGRALQEKCLHWRLPMGRGCPTVKDAWWALDEAKNLLRETDAFYGVPTEKGDYE